MQWIFDLILDPENQRPFQDHKTYVTIWGLGKEKQWPLRGIKHRFLKERKWKNGVTTIAVGITDQGWIGDLNTQFVGILFRFKNSEKEARDICTGYITTRSQTQLEEIFWETEPLISRITFKFNPFKSCEVQMQDSETMIWREGTHKFPQEYQ